jgi:hypothetical protein
VSREALAEVPEALVNFLNDGQTPDESLGEGLITVVPFTARSVYDDCDCRQCDELGSQYHSLKDWPNESGTVNVSKITADLGVLQNGNHRTNRMVRTIGRALLDCRLTMPRRRARHAKRSRFS